MLHITKEYLRENPNEVFVFGDNLAKKGRGGAASLRDEPNTYGFVTKKLPDNNDSSFFRPREYEEIYRSEVIRLREKIIENADKVFLISKIGSGLANRYNIFEEIIHPYLKADLSDLKNIKFLW